MGDVRLVERRDSALGHVVVLGVDDVEFLAGVDDGLDDLLGSLGVPLSGLLGHHVPVVVGSDLLVERAGAADLGSGAHDALDVDDVVGLEVLGSEPVNSGLAFLGHVGDDGSDIEALVSVDGAVEEDDLDAGGLRVLQDGIPAGGTGSGDEQVVDLVLDELLGGSDLLVVLQAVGEGSVIAVFLGEHGLQVLVVGGAVAGLVGVVVDDADLDERAVGSGGSLSSGVGGGLGGGSLSSGVGGGLGGGIRGGGRGRVGGLLRAGAEGGDHGDRQEQSKNLFHCVFLAFKICVGLPQAFACHGSI